MTTFFVNDIFMNIVSDTLENKELSVMKILILK
jgi:hypothetical protein